MPINYLVWDAMLKYCQKYIPKLTYIDELKDCFVDDICSSLFTIHGR